MNIRKALPRIVLAALILFGAVPPCKAAGQQTKIIRLWYRIQGNRTCLTFDAEGPKPVRIGPPSDTGISVFFSKMAVRLPDRSFTGAKTAMKGIKFWRGSNFFEVGFRWKKTKVAYSVRPGRRGSYALTFLLTPPAVKKTVAPAASNEPETTDFIKNVNQQTPPVHVEKVKTSELFGARVSARTRDAYSNKLQSAKAGEPQKGRVTKPGTAPFVEPGPGGLALYASANRKFQACAGNLMFCAPDIIENYRKALQEGPGSSQAPLAIYRTGLAYYSLGKYKPADQFFRAVTSKWPDNPLTCRCWIGIGDISTKNESYIEAMEAYRWALRDASQKYDIASADYALGKTYLLLGADKEALGMLQDCLTQQPDYFLKTPGVFRFIGEADFNLGDLDNAKQMLLRYVNCQEGDPDQGVILAKIAEIFLKQGQLDAAKKIYGFVHKYYTNSEGDMICRIRIAELMEKVDTDEAISMYEALQDKDLSPTLHSIVLIKLAELELKKSDLVHGLATLDEAFPVNGAKAAPPGIAPLRKKILCDLMRQLYFHKDFDMAVRVADKYRVVFDSVDSPETLEEIAESYAGKKSYLKALQAYDKLFLQQHGGNLDGLLLRCAVYALRLKDYARASHYAQAAQSGVLELKKSEILAQIFYRNEQYADAVAGFQKVLQQRNDFYLSEPDSYTAYGYSLYQMKKYEEAVPVLQKVLMRQTADKNARKSLLLTISDCLREQKQYGKAAEMIETAVRIASAGEKNELQYRLAKLYLEDGHSDQAVKNLNQIKATKDTFWSSVAQQELNTLQIAATTEPPGAKKP
ncbi:MAG: tetratricopeptide repeat protein [Syntrophobacteraceae bacterium]|nr:tetratricopeptide repeat protein [Syntrophobacteraceae bacterium]